MRAAMAATSEESSPPERNTPTLTSPIICCSTARTSASRVPARSASRSVTGVGATSGTAEAKRTIPSSGVHAQPGGNGSTNDCHARSKACISEAKRTAPSRRAQ